MGKGITLTSEETLEVFRAYRALQNLQYSKPATLIQIRQIQKLFDGIDRERRLNILSWMAEREITSSTKLTCGEAKAIIETFETSEFQILMSIYDVVADKPTQ